MQAARENLLLRNDTILGVCEAIGQDFGFNPNWLRLAFAGSFYWAPMLVIGAYLALGLVVAATRLAFPDRADAEVQPVAPQLAAENPIFEQERELVAA